MIISQEIQTFVFYEFFIFLTFYIVKMLLFNQWHWRFEIIKDECYYDIFIKYNEKYMNIHNASDRTIFIEKNIINNN